MRLPVRLSLSLLLATVFVPLSLGFTPNPAIGQAAVPSSAPAVSGDYTGQLGPLHLVLHVLKSPAGTLSGTLDSLDQGANGIPCEGFSLAGTAFSFKSAAVGGSYTGTVSADGKVITGTWSQGPPMPLVFTQSTAPAFVPADKPSQVDGDWSGAITTPHGSLPAVIHVKSDRAGQEFVAFDSPSQGALGLPGANAKLDGDSFSFDLPMVNGHYKGTLSADGNSIAGEWNQGAPVALNLTRQLPFAAADKPSVADGEWAGELTSSAGLLHLALHVKSDKAGREYATLDSPDQLTRDLAAEDVTLSGQSFRFTVPTAHHAQFSGTVSGDTLEGSWRQDNLAEPAAVHLTHAALPAPAEAAAAAPMSLKELKARLDAELSPMLENPALAGDEGIGVSIGLFADGQQRILTYGTAKPESLFEIGSITKTFTGLILAEMVTEGKLTLQTPVRELLPAGTVAKPDGPEITLLSLATHHSGLARMPDNFHPADPANPYADYSEKNLYEYIAKVGLALNPKATFSYSNLGMGLLGEALANRAGIPYAQLLQSKVLGPLGMAHTYIQIPAAEQKEFLPGHDLRDAAVHAWDLDSMAPAGGIRSDAADMMRYLRAQLDPPAGKLAQAVALQHQPEADADGGKIALNWMIEPTNGVFWHNGGTGGFTSYAFFQPDRKLAGVVLVNRSSALADALGMQIASLLLGKPANPLRR